VENKREEEEKIKKLRRKISKREKERKKKIKKGRVLWTFHSSHPPSTVRRSCFAKRFCETVSASPENPLHQHSHNRSCHSHSHS
jgi:hypothetical protein